MEQEQELALEQAPALNALDALDVAEARSEADADDAAVAAEAEQNADPAAAAAREQAAQLGAAMAVGFAEKMLRMRMPYVEIRADDRQALADSLAPVLRKHGGGMPAWLLPYAEELKFGMTLAGVGFGVWMQAQAHRDAQPKPAPAPVPAAVAVPAVPDAAHDPFQPPASSSQPVLDALDPNALE